MTGANDGIAECAFCVGAGKERLSDESQLGGVVNVVAGLVCLEPGGEFVGVVEDFLGGAGHGGQLRWIMSASGMPCLRALGAMSGAFTSTS